MLDLTLWSGTCFDRALVLTESAPECVAYGGRWAVIWCGLKLSIRCTGLGLWRCKVGHCLCPAWGHLTPARERSEDDCYMCWA